MKFILATALALGLGVSAAAADEPTNLLDAFKAWGASHQNEDGEYDRGGSSNQTVADQFGIADQFTPVRDTSGSQGNIVGRMGGDGSLGGMLD